MPKIKIPQQDLQSFLLESLKIDPFWYDLYGIKTNDNQHDKSQRTKTTK